MQNKMLFIGATHGDEPIGVRALRSIEVKRKDFDWVIGNEPAFDRGTRCFEGDLNRSAPGDLSASNYASRRAAEVLARSKNYEFTIDIHGTVQDTGLFLIVTNPSKENLELAKKFDVRRVVVWPSFSSELAGPMSEFFSCGLEIECGPKDSMETQKELERVIEKFLDGEPPIVSQQIFEVYGSLNKSTDVKLTEFNEATIDNENFFPLLIGTYTTMNGIVCYKMRSRSSSPS